jgi:hypothetical protein
MTVTLVAVVVVAAPPPEGVSVTVTLAGGIVPLGNPDPVTDSTEIPAWPVAGAAAAASVTWA